MPSFKDPDLGFRYRYRTDTEIRRLQEHSVLRGIPPKKEGRLLLGSWNIANLGAQARSDSDLRLCAEILRAYDLIAVQEIRDNYQDFEKIVSYLGAPYRFLFTDKAGNDERLAFVYDAEKVALRSLVGELVILPRERKILTFEVGGIKQKERFPGFNRNPYMAAFQVENFSFTLVNVHIYYGATRGAKFRRRVLEIYTLASWAHKRVTQRKNQTYDSDILLIGDMNVPTRKKKDKVFAKLIKFGMQPTLHASQVGSNLGGTQTYDQITFLPSQTPRFTGQSVVFDFDNAVFASLWDKLETSLTHFSNPQQREKEKIKQFRAYLRFHLSDHRPIWAVFETE